MYFLDRITTNAILRTLLAYKKELISDVLLWEATHGKRKPGRPPTSYITQLTEVTDCTSTEVMRTAMENIYVRKQRGMNY